MKAYTAQEVAQGAKSGAWAALNRKNGATFNPTHASFASTSASAAVPSSSVNARTVTLESVLPSQHVLMTNLGPLRIEYPDNWQVMMPKQQGQSLTIAPQAGVTADGVGYGVVLNGLKLPDGEHMSIDDVTRQLVHEMEQNETLQQTGEAQPIKIAGSEGRSLNLHSVSPFADANGRPQRERDWLVIVPRRDGSVIYMVFVAPQTHFDRFQQTYATMLKSVQF